MNAKRTFWQSWAVAWGVSVLLHFLWVLWSYYQKFSSLSWEGDVPVLAFEIVGVLFVMSMIPACFIGFLWASTHYFIRKGHWQYITKIICIVILGSFGYYNFVEYQLEKKSYQNLYKWAMIDVRTHRVSTKFLPDENEQNKTLEYTRGMLDVLRLNRNIDSLSAEYEKQRKSVEQRVNLLTNDEYEELKSDLMQLGIHRVENHQGKSLDNQEKLMLSIDITTLSDHQKILKSNILKNSQRIFSPFLLISFLFLAMLNARLGKKSWVILFILVLVEYQVVMILWRNLSRWSTWWSVFNINVWDFLGVILLPMILFFFTTTRHKKRQAT